MKQFAVAVTQNILIITFDTVVFLLTIAKTWQLYRQWRAISMNWRTSLTAVLLHDGLFGNFCCISLWFCVLFFRNHVLLVSQNNAFTPYWTWFSNWIAVSKCWPLLLSALVWSVKGVLAHLMPIYWFFFGRFPTWWVFLVENKTKPFNGNMSNQPIATDTVSVFQAASV